MKQTFGARIKPGKVIYQWDSSMPGLGIRINRDGTQCYIARTWHKGECQSFTIGHVDLLDVDRVRNMVGRMKLVAKTGQDPTPVLESFIRAQVLPEAYGTTFGEWAKIYIEEYAKVHKAKSWHKDQGMINFHLLPIWKNRPLESITRTEVQAFHAEIGKTRPIAANRLIEVIQIMWKQATYKGYLPERLIGITAGIRSFREPTRDRIITDDEKARILGALDRCKGNRWQVAALKLDFMLGFRSGEIITLQWEKVDLDHREIRLDDTKSGRPFTLPLPRAAVDLLAGLSRHNRWVFPSHLKEGEHIARIDTLFKKACSLAGVRDVRLHDIRRHVGCSVLAKTGSLEMVGAVLNHSSLQTTRVYAKYQTDHMRAALESHTTG